MKFKAFEKAPFCLLTGKSLAEEVKWGLGIFAGEDVVLRKWCPVA